MSSDDVDSSAPEGAKKFSDLERSIRIELDIFRSKINEYKEAETLTFKNIGELVNAFCENDHMNFVLQYDNYVDLVKETLISKLPKLGDLFSKYEMLCLGDETTRTNVIKRQMEKKGLNWEKHNKVVVMNCMSIRKEGLRNVRYYIDKLLKHAFGKVPVFFA